MEEVYRERMSGLKKRGQLLNEVEGLHNIELRHLERSPLNQEYIRRAEHVLRLGSYIRESRELYEMEFKYFEKEFNDFIKDKGEEEKEELKQELRACYITNMYADYYDSENEMDR
jgi:hypothetical protein